MPRTLFGRSVTSLVAGFALASTLSLGPRAAHAFCRTMTVRAPPDYDPTKTHMCFSETLPENDRIPLFWRNACVGYSLNRRGSNRVAFDQARTVIAAAFVKWTGATCPTDGGGQSRVSIDVRDLGPVDCDTVELNGRGPNQNVIIFRDDEWSHGDTVLGLTTTSVDVTTGELFNVDMEINTTVKLAFEDPVPPDAFDFDAIVTHEIGHFFGVAHSEDPYATMAASIPIAFTRPRLLSRDDIAGLCEIYRPDGSRTVLKQKIYVAPQCDPTPRRGFTSSCKEPAGLCSVARPGRASAGPAASFLVGICALGLALRRRSRANGARRGGRLAPPGSSCASRHARAR